MDSQVTGTCERPGCLSGLDLPVGDGTVGVQQATKVQIKCFLSFRCDALNNSRVAIMLLGWKEELGRESWATNETDERLDVGLEAGPARDRHVHGSV